MEKEFVPYELALRMKQLGFDEPCFSFYAGGFNELWTMKLVNPNKVHQSNVLAPLYQQAFRWFREKYNVHMVPSKYDENRWWVQWGTWTSSVFNTYKEAEVACLTKLIEIAEGIES